MSLTPPTTLLIMFSVLLNPPSRTVPTFSIFSTTTYFKLEISKVLSRGVIVEAHYEILRSSPYFPASFSSVP